MEHEMIRDQLICNAYLTAERDKLLFEDKLTLEKLPRLHGRWRQRLKMLLFVFS